MKNKHEYRLVKEGQSDGYTLYTLFVDDVPHSGLNLMEVVELMKELER